MLKAYRKGIMKLYISDASKAPKAIGPYSQAVIVGNMAFLSGQIPLDPQSGEMIVGGIEEQTDRVMENIQAVLKHIKLDFSHIVKTTIFLTDLSHFQTVNGIYGRWLGDFKPARSTIQVAALPKGAAVEIEVLAAWE